MCEDSRGEFDDQLPGRALFADQEFLDHLHCPRCARPLRREPIADAFAVGLRCPCDHRFFVESRLPGSTDMQMVPNPPTGGWGIGQRWAEEPMLRNHISGQVAVILRRISEIRLHGRHIERENETAIYLYCPMCGKALEHSAEDSDWGQGLRCGSGHRYEARSGLLLRGRPEVRLCSDMADANVAFLAQRYAEEPVCRWWRIIPSVQAILARFAREWSDGTGE